MQPTILLTGATGQIGRWLTFNLLRHGHALVLTLRDPARQLPQLAAWLSSRGAPTGALSAIATDLARPDLGWGPSQADLAGIDTVYHLAARFGWGLPSNVARAVNVTAGLTLLHWFARQPAPRQFIHVSGYMLQVPAHLRRLGITGHQDTDWRRVYRMVGSYEASKLEAHFAMRAAAAHSGVPLTVVHPATVNGHAVEGEIPASAALADLIRQLLAGKLAAIPGSPRHWLPLVGVDYVAAFMAGLAQHPDAAGGDYLLLDQQTPRLDQVVHLLADTLGVHAPRRHLPLPVLDLLLRVPGIAALSGSHREALHFIRTEQFDTGSADRLAAHMGIAHPPIGQALTSTARYIAASLAGADKMPARLPALERT